MVKNILTKILFCFFSSQILLFELNPYKNFYTSKPTGTVKESLEKLSENRWKITSIGKHPLFNAIQESIFRIDNGIVILESGYRKLDILGGIRKDHQTYKIEKKGDQKLVNYSYGKKTGTLEIKENFYDNLTLQIQIKLNLLEKDKIEINYFDKGKIKRKTFFNKKDLIAYKAENVEVFEFTEQRDDKRYFKFFIRNDLDKDTLRVSQGGRGFNVDWELN